MTDEVTQPLLAISNLTVSHPSGPAILTGLNLTLSRGEAVGILGASGCGKTTLARAIPGLLPPRCAVTGMIEFAGHDVLRMNTNALRKLRGAHIASLFQEPSLSLSPHLHAGAQIAEVIAAHRGLRNGELTSAVLEILDPLFRGESPRIALAYPHELSGGERQRVAIARALCCAPELLIADEPTASLDSIGQREALALLAGYREQTGMSMILVSHNRAGLRKHTDRCLELRDGGLEPA